nr:hypothetical protein [Ardenticatena sp.]
MPRFSIPHPDDVADDVRCYYRHARRMPEPVVELGVVHGRYTLTLADQHIRMVAVGEDEGLLQALQVFAQERHLPVETLAAAWPQVRLPFRPGMLFLPEGRLTRLLAYEAVMAFLRHVHGLLQVGGKFMFDVPLPDMHAIAPYLLPTGQTLIWRGSTPLNDGGVRHVWERRAYDVVAQCETRHIVEEDVDATGTTRARRHRLEERGWFWPRELRAMLDATGFFIEAVYGGFNDEALTDASSVQVWVVRKPAA